MSFAVNYNAVVAAAVVGSVIGGVWYGPVFGKRWSALLARPGDRMGQAPLGLAVAVAAALVNAWALAFLAVNANVTGALDGIVLGFFAWLGLMATITATMTAFEGRSWKLWLLNNAHNVLVQAVMGAIVAAWR
ncbi:MAG: DUF1761 domain-containing protein [Chloroflexota bacterium]|nr:DUF1761 family protein [Chloroflexota bacterium]MDE3101625.1 DUF1761 domain-containing protein [Chloroflexota bacterium]